jgi:hypothetical protein
MSSARETLKTHTFALAALHTGTNIVVSMFLEVIIGSAIVYYFFHEFYGKRKGLPPGPTPWPIVGNLLQFDQKQPEKTLFEWGKKYGSVFTVWLPQPMVIVNDHGMMKETFLKQGDTFAGRPETFFMNTLFKGNYGLALSTGKLWRENRRFSMHALRDFGIGRNTLQPQIMDQATQLIANLHNTTGPVTLRDPFTVKKMHIYHILFSNIALLSTHIRKLIYYSLPLEMSSTCSHLDMLGNLET